MPSAELIQTWENIALSLAPTPRYDKHGQVIPLGKPEPVVRYYVVWVGRAVGIFMNWGIANAMTCGFPGASHKKYETLEAAQLAWRQGPLGHLGEWLPPLPPAVPSLPRAPSPTASSLTDLDDRHSDGSSSDPPSGAESPPGGQQFGAYHATQYVKVAIPRDLKREISSEREGDTALADPRPSSPTPSSISSISRLSELTISTGTLSTSDVRTPRIPTPSLGVSTPARQTSPIPSTPTSPITSRSLSCGPGKRREPAPIRITPASATPDRRMHGRQTPTPAFQPRAERVGDGHGKGKSPQKQVAGPSFSQDASVSKPPKPLQSSAPQTVVVPERRDVYVVVRGDRPGVYLDRNTAMLMLGTSPGMKIVRFHSRKGAAWYFVQEYMAGRVGIPVVVVDDD
ncbi:hypothetical protein FKP32DRAFT_1676737 [Trametes sanguinea]|nr:hypothetical protein FKP32DRAFT_1676737 [Trametes sanguinea]